MARASSARSAGRTEVPFADTRSDPSHDHVYTAKTCGIVELANSTGRLSYAVVPDLSPTGDALQ